MTFYRKEYFNEVVEGVRKYDNQIRIFCLTASFETILKRLEKRGGKIESEQNNWSIQKAKECIESHKDVCFGETINTNELNAERIADEILKRLS